MSSFDDLSLISGISNISRISRTNSSVLYKLDSTWNISSGRSMCIDANRSFCSDNQKADSKKLSEIAKVNKALVSCEESTCDYAILKLVNQCLEEIAASNDTGIEKSTTNKLKEFITIQKIKKYLHLPNNSKDLKEELTLLGIIDLPKHEFSYEEQLSIKSCLEAKLREKIHSFIRIYEVTAGSTKEILKCNESILCSRFQQKGELESMHWKDKIDEVYLEYRRDLQQCLTMLNQWNDLKLKVHEKNVKIAEDLSLQAKIAEMRVIITKLTCTIRMYKETPTTLQAFKSLKESLEEKMICVNEEIAKKTELIRVYNALSSTEYDEILRKYTELCHIIEKKRNLLDKL